MIYLELTLRISEEKDAPQEFTCQTFNISTTNNGGHRPLFPPFARGTQIFPSKRSLCVCAKNTKTLLKRKKKLKIQRINRRRAKRKLQTP